MERSLFSLAWIGWLCVGVLVNACGASSSPLLYPTAPEQDLRTICTTVHQTMEQPSQSYIRESLPVLVTVNPQTVTVYFVNNYSYSLPKDESVRLSPGSYFCPP